MIEFIESDRTWLFPQHRFTHAVLLENPEHHGKKTLPPDLLRIYFRGAEISLLGWRLEQVSDIHVEADLTPL